jgi:hypothetical protein
MVADLELLGIRVQAKALDELEDPIVPTLEIS